MVSGARLHLQHGLRVAHARAAADFGACSAGGASARHAAPLRQHVRSVHLVRRLPVANPSLCPQPLGGCAGCRCHQAALHSAVFRSRTRNVVRFFAVVGGRARAWRVPGAAPLQLTRPVRLPLSHALLHRVMPRSGECFLILLTTVASRLPGAEQQGCVRAGTSWATSSTRAACARATACGSSASAAASSATARSGARCATSASRMRRGPSGHARARGAGSLGPVFPEAGGPGGCP